jgi:hypothetical protein
MLVTHDLVRYVTAAHEALVIRGNPNSVATTSTCPECGSEFDSRVDAMSDNDGAHLILELSGDVFAVIVGCEGYWVINPALIGIPADNWQPNALGDELTQICLPTCAGGSACVCGPEWDRPATMD